MKLLWPIATTTPQLSTEEAHVWAVPLGEMDVASRIGRSLALLSPDERDQANEFRIETPRRQFVVTRAALRTLLSYYLDERPEDISFSFEAIAKPKLAGKYAGANLQFNVSHSGDLALIVVTAGSDVGVDVEQCRDVKQLEQLARRYFHAAEVEALLATAPAARNDAFLRCWTAKEAVLKAYGTGIASVLDAFEVPLAPSFEGWIDLSELRIVGKPSQCWLKRLEPCAGYVSAVALLAGSRRLICHSFRA